MTAGQDQASHHTRQALRLWLPALVAQSIMHAVLGAFLVQVPQNWRNRYIFDSICLSGPDMGSMRRALKTLLGSPGSGPGHAGGCPMKAM